MGRSHHDNSLPVMPPEALTQRRGASGEPRDSLRLRVPAKVRTALKSRGVKSILATLTITAKHIGGRAKTSHRVVRIRL